jgi:hypothetical protein
MLSIETPLPLKKKFLVPVMESPYVMRLFMVCIFFLENDVLPPGNTTIAGHGKPGPTSPARPGPKMARPVGPKHAVGPGLGRIFWPDKSNGPGLGRKK